MAPEQEGGGSRDREPAPSSFLLAAGLSCSQAHLPRGFVLVAVSRRRSLASQPKHRTCTAGHLRGRTCGCSHARHTIKALPGTMCLISTLKTHLRCKPSLSRVFLLSVTLRLRESVVPTVTPLTSSALSNAAPTPAEPSRQIMCLYF